MMPRSILAVTATAGPKVIADIAKTLGIEEGSENNDGVLIVDKARDNIDVACEYVESQESRLHKVRALLFLFAPMYSEAYESMVTRLRKS